MASMQTLAVAVLFLATVNGGPAASQDVANGEDVFKKCRPCHQVGGVVKNGVGPTLDGIVGRAAGSVPGFAYSEANKEAGAKGLVWSEDVLMKYLENPAAFVPKTKMVFVGLKDEQDRKDVIAYLKTFSKP